MFPKSFLQICFESPCLGATKGTKPGAQVRVPNLLQECMCSIGSLGFDPWFNWRYISWGTGNTLQFSSCALSLGDCLNVIQTCAIAAGSPVQWDCSAPGGQQMAVHLPACYILYGTVLCDLSSSSSANLPPLCPFPSWLSTGQQHFPVALLAGHWVHKGLQSAAPGSSRNLFCSPPSSTAQSSIQPLNTREISILRLDVSPSSLNNNPAWAQMSCQAGWWCCFKFTIIYFSNLISKMEMHISAHDFQLISYFLSAFQCCWNALCYRQNTLIMMGLFFQQLPLSNVTHGENGKFTLPSCVKHLKRREEKELVVKCRWWLCLLYPALRKSTGGLFKAI